EFDYKADEKTEVRSLGTLLDSSLGGEEMRLKTHLAVISDNAFSFSTKYATEVMARIRLDPKTKTVETGALFYEEFLPAGTILYSLAIAEEPRGTNGHDLKSADDVLGFVNGCLDHTKNESVIQIGANATTGKGLCTA